MWGLTTFASRKRTDNACWLTWRDVNLRVYRQLKWWNAMGIPPCITGLMVRTIGLRIFGLQTAQHYDMLHPFAKAQLRHRSSQSQKIGEQVPPVTALEHGTLNGHLYDRWAASLSRRSDWPQTSLTVILCLCSQFPVQYSGSSSSLSSLCFSFWVVVVLNLIYYLISDKYGYM